MGSGQDERSREAAWARSSAHLGVDGIESVLRVNEGRGAALLLDRGDRVHGQRGLAAALRAVHLQAGETIQPYSAPAMRCDEMILGLYRPFDSSAGQHRLPQRKAAALQCGGRGAVAGGPAVSAGAASEMRTSMMRPLGKPPPRAISSVRAPQEMCSLYVTCPHQIRREGAAPPA